MSKSLQEKIDEIFLNASSSSSSPAGTCDFRSVATTFWPILDNSISLVDIAGVFAMTGSADAIDSSLFSEFFSGIARVKYPSGTEFKEKLLDDLHNAKEIKILSDTPSFVKAMDRSVIKVLLKFDLPLRRCFSSFAGQAVNIGGGFTWEEVKRLSVGMEIEGIVAFASSHSLIPSSLTTQQCEIVSKDLAKDFPVIATTSTRHTTLLFPQFQLFLCFIALEIFDTKSRRDDNKGVKIFATKKVDERNQMFEILHDLLKSLGIEKSSPEKKIGKWVTTTENTKTVERYQDSGSSMQGSISLPMSEKPEDHYAIAMNHGRQAMLMRMDHLFDDIEQKISPSMDPNSEIMQHLCTPVDDITESKSRLASKPVVIGDAIPIPSSCPEVVEQLLQAALAHHNLGSFEESLKFLEASRIQLVDIGIKIAKSLRANAIALEKVSLEEGKPLPETKSKPDISENDIKIPLDLDLYIILCKGNVYQSCGDDEQSLLKYIEGLNLAVRDNDKDWEIVCLNSIGTLAYYSLRYDVALICFAAVAIYRETAYGVESVDTATAWNNEACALYCINKRRESRVRLERAWNITCKSLGHRAPRSVTVWKNLEKSRRAHASVQSKRDIKESAEMRPDAARLLLDGNYMINAIPPPDGSKKTKKKKGGGKKKK